MSQDVIPNFIAGEWRVATATASLPVQDPASGELLGRVPLSEAVDVARAVAAAVKAFPGWRATTPVERVRVLFRLHGLLNEHHEELAQSLTREHGKVIAEARAEIQRGIDSVEHACAIPTLMMGETLEDVAHGIDCETVRQPLGVFAGITPYNFPVMIPMWFWPYAIATGNTFVLKPSEQNPLTHNRVMELARRAGLPAGVLNVVHGGRETVDAILTHPDIKGVSFVGSSHVASIIYTKGAAAGKRVQALGGAKNHAIILPDAGIDYTSDHLVAAAFGSAGERCMAISAAVAVGGAADELIAAVSEKARAVKVGDRKSVV